MNYDELPDILTVKDVAKYLRISTGRVRELCESGELVGMNFGTARHKHWRVAKEDVRNLQAIAKEKRRPANSRLKPGLCVKSHMGL
jgi:excisionase family DNA binding protein